MCSSKKNVRWPFAAKHCLQMLDTCPCDTAHLVLLVNSSRLGVLLEVMRSPYETERWVVLERNQGLVFGQDP